MNTERQPSALGRLVPLFFAKFFNNDLIGLETDQQTVIGIAIALAMPPVVATFYARKGYSQADLWGLADPQYFFIVYALAAMGIAAIFAWDQLYPDRTDAFVVGTMPLPKPLLLCAKAAALLQFLSIFLVAAVGPATLTMTLVSTQSALTPSPLRHLMAQLVSTAAAGLFIASVVVALRALCVICLPARWLRVAAAVAQVGSITLLLNLLFSSSLVSSHLQALIARPTLAHRLPPVWFLGLYEYLAYGSAAQPEFRSLAIIGLWATVLVVLAATLLYGVGWPRQMRNLVEGGESAARSGGWLTRPLMRLLNAVLLRNATRRATFHFIGKLLARNTRHRVFLSMYLGVGLAFGASFLLRIDPRGVVPRLVFAPRGAVMMALVMSYCVVSGLRAAFHMPVEPQANWLYQLTEDGNRLQHVYATRLWVALGSVVLVFLYTPLLWANSAPAEALRHLTFLVVLQLWMVHIMFRGFDRVPFTCRQAPGKVNIIARGTVYFFGFPLAVLAVADIERAIAKKPEVLLVFVVLSVVSLMVMHVLEARRLRGVQPLVFVEPPEGAVLTLGLEASDSQAMQVKAPLN